MKKRAKTDRRSRTRDTESMALYKFVCMFGNIGEAAQYEVEHMSDAGLKGLKGADFYNKLAEIRMNERIRKAAE